MTTQPTGSHRSTYEAIFQHPVARNVHWRDVRSLLAALADVAEEPNGNLKVCRGNLTLVLRPSRDNNVAEVEELMAIRHFLQRSGAASPDKAAEGTHLLVVIDHREARIYRAELRGSVPQRITPYDPHGLSRHLHYVQDQSHGQRKPERKSYYQAVARTLQAAEQVLLFGNGTGASSAMDHLFADLRRRHPQVARRIIGRVVVDEPHLTENQLLAQARAFYAALASEETSRASEARDGQAHAQP